MIGRTIANYRVLEKLGEGGMGVVYKARDTRLGRFAALKFLHATRAEEEERRRFLHEAQAASALDHPNICTVYEASETDEGLMFIAMAYYDGETLAKRIERGPMPVQEACNLALQISQGLAKAHANGITHRDLKPNNVIVTRDGLVKIVDFGLAKLAGATKITKTGSTMGTPRYMSPEQVRGEDVDAASDVWSFGAILYEMLAGRPAFGGGHEAAVYYAIQSLEPHPVRGIPRELSSIIQRAIVKDCGRRRITAADIAAELQPVLSDKRPAPTLADVLHQPRYTIPALAVIGAVLILAGWWGLRQMRIERALTVTLPEAQRLFQEGDWTTAWHLGHEARRQIPGNKELTDLLDRVSFRANVRTDPPGAEVFWRNFYDTAENPKWERIGVTPVENYRFPIGHIRLRTVKPGYRSVEVANVWLPGEIPFRLFEGRLAPQDMVFVPGGPHQMAGSKPVELQDYWIDQFEVTNGQFKEFVDAEGYRKQEYWRNEFVKAGKKLKFEEAINEFRDATARPGPSPWEVGSYPSGQERLPVGGVSWYEAAAYCEWKGKSLPTVYHWDRMAGKDMPGPGGMLMFSNFGNKGPAAVGTYQGLGPYGTYDTAGNVKEWTWNGSGELRYILGGSWGEPSYMFSAQIRMSQFDRSSTHGFRCAKYSQPAGAALLAPVELLSADFRNVKPVNDQVFETYRSFYDYDRTPLNAKVEKVDDSAEYWRKETVTFDAAYGGERVIGRLYLPKAGSPPFQTVVYVPSGVGELVQSSDNTAEEPFFNYIVRSGRAVLLVVIRETYERRSPKAPSLGARGPNEERDVILKQTKDVRRAIDYLATRKEFDTGKLGYCGVSTVGWWGTIHAAMEPRIKVILYIGAGFIPVPALAEVDAVNHAPRVKVPALMVNGRYDSLFGLETNQIPFLHLLGASEKDKRHAIYDSGHIPPRQEMIKESLAWLEKYLGPVN